MRTHIVIADDLVKAVDALVGNRKRSQFFNNVIRNEINRLKRLAAAKKAAGSLKDVDIPGWETSKSAAKWVRDLRRESDRELNR